MYTTPTSNQSNFCILTAYVLYTQNAHNIAYVHTSEEFRVKIVVIQASRSRHQWFGYDFTAPCFQFQDACVAKEFHIKFDDTRH